MAETFAWVALLCLCTLLPMMSCGTYRELILDERNDDFANEGVEMAILYGYNVDRSTPNYLKRVNKIFEVDRNKDLTINSDSRVKMSLEYSDSETTASDNMEMAVGLKVRYGAFSAAASMKVSKSSSSNIKTVRMDSIIKAIKYRVSAKGKFLIQPSSFLISYIKEAMKTLSVEEIEDKIGVFYATSLNLGGEIKKSYIMQAMESDTESSVKAELSASYGSGLIGVSGSASAGTTSRTSNKKAKMSQKWAAQGGDTTIWLGKNLNSAAAVNDIARKWAKTITNDNLYPSDFHLVEMWKLVKKVDAKKGQEYEDYLRAKWKKQANAFHPMEFLQPAKPCYSGNDRKQQDYRGKQSRTATGKVCQRWSSQYPHKHEVTAQNYPDAGLEANYCRNADGTTEAWCYTMNSNTRWQFCAVPHCDDCYSGHDSKQRDYRGMVSKTETGKTCQNWLSQNPHGHGKNNPSQNAEQGLGNHNYCRNTDDADRAWCYTTDPNTRWEYCSLPRC